MRRLLEAQHLPLDGVDALTDTMVVASSGQEIIGAAVHRKVAVYTPHPAEEPLSLQDHGRKVRFRNIWARRISGYDQQ